MNPSSEFGIRIFMVALAQAGLRLAPPAKDPCSLLKPADIQALAPTAKISSGVLTENGPLGGTCTYSWGPRTNEWGNTALSVTVVDVAKAWPGGMSSDAVKQRVLGEIKTAGPDASEISGIGDGAVFTTQPKSYSAKAKAYLVKSKGALLEVQFHGGNALAQKDKLIVLLKTASAAL